VDCKHYSEGIINHRTDLFGKVVKEEELVSKIKYYATHNMKMEAKYKEKTKRFVMKQKSGTRCKFIFKEMKSVKK
jgi:hypothetical protein